MAARARTREVFRPDRDLAVEARSPPTQMSCGFEPELKRPPGRRNSAWMTKLVVYNDENTDGTTYYLAFLAALFPPVGGRPLSLTLWFGVSFTTCPPSFEPCFRACGL